VGAVVQPAIAEFIRTSPKVELHVHLEGAMSADTVWRLADRNGIRLPGGSAEGWRDQYRFRDFNHFIDLYTLASGAMRTAEDFAHTVERFCAGQAAQRILHSEVFLSTSLHLGKLPGEELADALAEGVRRGRDAHGVGVVVLADISRHLPATARAVLDFALMARGRHPGVFVGLQLGGKEEGFPPELFAGVYADARAAGLHCIAHAGEGAGPESVRGAVEVLRVERIGHGLRCLEDPALVELLRDRRIPFEVCPTSNVCLKVVPDLARHPLPLMLELGLTVTLNSDDPAMFGTTLTQEFLRTADAFGFGLDTVKALSRNAIRAAFLPAAAREELEAEFERGGTCCGGSSCCG